MARRAGYTRIERNVIREFGSYQGNAIKLLQAEHARAVRIVKATRKRVAQDTATYNDVERIIIDVVLQGLMDDLQKGRA